MSPIIFFVYDLLRVMFSYLFLSFFAKFWSLVISCLYHLQCLFYLFFINLKYYLIFQSTPLIFFSLSIALAASFLVRFFMIVSSLVFLQSILAHLFIYHFLLSYCFFCLLIPTLRIYSIPSIFFLSHTSLQAF